VSALRTKNELNLCVSALSFYFGCGSAAPRNSWRLFSLLIFLPVSCSILRLMRKNLWCFIALSFYVLCIAAVNPVGEFPLNDDWSYIRSAFSFASGHGMRVDEWSAPSLVGQALYGGLLARLFSPDFLVLRISTLLLSCLTAVLLWKAFRRIGFRAELAGIMLLAWVFDPLQFNLSFTFMTEIPFLFFISLAIYLYVLHQDTLKAWPLLLSSAALGYAYLIRQTALFFILALIFSILIDSRKGRRLRIQESILAACTAGAFVAAYYAWSMTRGGATAAVHRKLELLQWLTAKQIIGNSFGLLFYLAFMLLPLWIFLTPSLFRIAGTFARKIQIGVLSTWSLIACFGIWWFRSHYVWSQYLPSKTYHARMPFLINVLYDSGLGPITLDPAYFGPSPTPVYPRVWTAVTVIVAILAVLLGSLATFGLIRRQSLKLCRERAPLFVFFGIAFAGIVAFEIVFGHLQEGGVFDRHILGPALPLLFWTGFLFHGKENGEKEAGRSAVPILTGIALAALTAFSVAATRDYMEWNRIRWEMGRNLLAQGVNPLAIVGGFEFNAWNNYDNFVARGNVTSVRHWWFDTREYIISMAPQAGYDVLQKKSYYSWVHRRPIEIFLIRNSKFKIRD
jgi:hypothetical protein